MQYDWLIYKWSPGTTKMALDLEILNFPDQKQGLAQATISKVGKRFDKCQEEKINLPQPKILDKNKLLPGEVSIPVYKLIFNCLHRPFIN